MHIKYTITAAVLYIRSRGAACDVILANNRRRDELLHAGQRLLSTLRDADVDRNSRVSLEEFKNAFNKVLKGAATSCTSTCVSAVNSN